MTPSCVGWVNVAARGSSRTATRSCGEWVKRWPRRCLEQHRDITRIVDGAAGLDGTGLPGVLRDDPLRKMAAAGVRRRCSVADTGGGRRKALARAGPASTAVAGAGLRGLRRVASRIPRPTGTGVVLRQASVLQ